MPPMPRPDLPPLPLEAWEPTKTTLHLWSQIVGKVRLATAAPRNHWWHAALYVDVRGLTTRRLHRPAATFEIALDLLDHRLVVRTSHDQLESFPLHEGLSVAEFDALLHETLGRVGVDVPIRESPYGLATTTPFPEDREHASYDGEYAQRLWRVLDWSDAVLEEFAGWFSGKTSPVHFFWHSFDLALTRFSGRRAPPSDGDAVSREAYSHEVISFGFWPGDPEVPYPAYYAYAAPEPEGLIDRPLAPAGPGGRTGRPATWRSSPTRTCARRPIRAVRCSHSSRAPTTQGAWPGGGIASTSCRPGLRRRRSSPGWSRADPAAGRRLPGGEAPRGGTAHRRPAEPAAAAGSGRPGSAGRRPPPAPGRAIGRRCGAPSTREPSAPSGIRTRDCRLERAES